MRNIILILLLFIFQNVGAQQGNKFRWTTSVSAGMMFGETTDNFHMKAMSGIRYATWQLSAGGGVDCYYYRSVPVFFNLSKDLLNKKNTPFVSIDLGTNFPWVKNQEEYEWFEYDYHKGLYGSAEAGYRMPLNSKISLSVSAGYSQKNLHADKIYYGFRNPGPPFEKFETSREYFSYKFNRLFFSVGLTF